MATSTVQGLTALYDALGGASWAANTNWNSASEPCDASLPWYGLVCSGSDLTGIDLDSNGLVGSLPTQVGLLGCEFAVENGAYRITKLYQAPNWHAELRALDNMIQVREVAITADLVRPTHHPLSERPSLHGRWDRKSRRRRRT